MKWILCGKNDAGVAALEFLLERGDDVWVIATAGDDGADGWQRSLAGVARTREVRCEQPKRINDSAVIESLAAYGADALLSIQYDQILRGPLFRALDCPCLNFHFALLPRHRGVSPIAFAVLEGDAEAGVTLHEMVEDIDAGDVIAQRAVAIGAGDTAREVYDRVSDAAVALFRERYPFDASRRGVPVAQDEARASYHRAGDFDFSACEVDWGRPAPELQRWLRAMIFPPFQFPEILCPGETLRIERVAAAVGAANGAPPGTVLSHDAGEVRIAALGGSVGIASVVDADGRDARERLRVDDRLGVDAQGAPE